MTVLDALPQSTSLAQLVAPDVYRITTGISNAYLVVLPGAAAGYVVIDAGDKGYGSKIVRAARQLFEHNRPHAIILTHAHFDHAGGVPELLDHWPDVPVYAHPLEHPYLNDARRYPPGDPTVGGVMAETSRFLDTSRPTILPTRAQALPEDAGELDIMPGWELRPSPGHTPGHVSFWNPEERVLIAGDAISTMSMDNPLINLGGRPTLETPPPYATYNWHHARQSARSLSDLQPAYLLAGHGRPMVGRHVARELSRFTACFPVPKRGRYVHTPARFNREGPTFVPPKPADYVKQVVLTGAGLALGVALYAIFRPRRRTVQEALEG